MIKFGKITHRLYMKYLLLSLCLLYPVIGKSQKLSIDSLKSRILKNVSIIDTLSLMSVDWDSISLNLVERLDQDILLILQNPDLNIKDIFDKKYFQTAFSEDSVLMAVNFWEPSFGTRGGISHTFLRWKDSKSKYAIKRLDSLGFVFSISKIHKLNDSIYLLVGSEKGNSTNFFNFAVPLKLKSSEIKKELNLFPSQTYPQYSISTGYLKLMTEGLECQNCWLNFNPENKSFKIDAGKGESIIRDSDDENDYYFIKSLTIKFDGTKFRVIEEKEE